MKISSSDGGFAEFSGAKQFGEDGAGGSAERAIGDGGQTGFRGVDFDDARAALTGEAGKAAGGHDDGGSSDDEEEAAAARGLFGGEPGMRGQRFAEPDDAGALNCAAGTLRGQGRERGLKVLFFLSAGGAARGPDAAMQVDDAAVSGAGMEAVDVPGDEGGRRGAGFEIDESQAAAIKVRRQSYHSQTSSGLRAKASGVARSSGRKERHNPPVPRKVGTPLSADAGSCKHGDVGGVAQPTARFLHA